MNLRWGDNPELRQVVLACLLLLFLGTLSYLISLVQPSVSGLELFARANRTRTAIALTSNALLGPFPTATGPSPTPPRTPEGTLTPTVTWTPSLTPTRTPFVWSTGTLRTGLPSASATVTRTATLRPTATRTPTRSRPTACPATASAVLKQAPANT